MALHCVGINKTKLFLDSYLCCVSSVRSYGHSERNKFKKQKKPMLSLAIGGGVGVHMRHGIETEWKKNCFNEHNCNVRRRMLTCITIN